MNENSWVVSFTYQHSDHRVTINSTANSAENSTFPSWVWDAATVAVAVGLITAACLLVWLSKKKADG